MGPTESTQPKYRRLALAALALVLGMLIGTPTITSAAISTAPDVSELNQCDDPDPPRLSEDLAEAAFWDTTSLPVSRQARPMAAEPAVWEDRNYSPGSARAPPSPLLT